VSDLETRLTTLEARLELTELAARYCHRIDAGDYGGAAAMFSPDGILAVPDGRTNVGRDAIETFLRGQLDAYQSTYHYVHSQVLDDLSDRDARGVVDAHAEHAEDGTCLLAGIRYADVYVHHADGWRFARRDLQIRYFLPWQKLDSRYRRSEHFPVQSS
jgi:hypothetical protein